MAGPATNITTITVTLKILGKKSTAIYLSTIIVISLISGYILDLILVKDYFENQSTHLHHHYGILTYICSGLLVLIILNSIRIKYFFNNKERTNSSIESKNQKNTFQIYVKGMTCSHCVDSVTKSLLNLSGVKEIQVDLDSGQVNVSGEDFNKDIIVKNILSLGYTIKEK
jgi:copper chaperone CopZ